MWQHIMYWCVRCVQYREVCGLHIPPCTRDFSKEQPGRISVFAEYTNLEEKEIVGDGEGKKEYLARQYKV